MAHYFEILTMLFQRHSWLIQPMLVLLIATVLTYTCYLVHRRLQPRLAHNGHPIVDALLQAIYWPLIVSIWVEATFAILRLFTHRLDEALISLLDKIREIGLILLLAWVFVRFIRSFEGLLLSGHLTKRHPDETTVQATGKLLRVAAVIIVVLFVMPVLGIPVSGIVAFGGGSAIVVGIGAQQILANYFGGLLIYSDRHFKVGDWIYSPDKQIEGTVEYIGWRATQIRTFDKRALYVPNAAFSSIIVVNASRMTNRRIKETIGIRYRDAQVLQQITEEIRTMLQAHPGIDQRQTLMVHFTAFAPSSLNIEVYTFTKTRDWKTYRDVQQDVFLKIIEIVENNDAEMAFPTSTIHPGSSQLGVNLNLSGGYQLNTHGDLAEVDA